MKLRAQTRALFARMLTYADAQTRALFARRLSR
jgi:hypothetical protein